MASRPAFASKTIRSEATRIGAGASTSRDASVTTNILPLFTAGAAGSRIEVVEFIALANTTPGSIRLFTLNGSTYRLRREIAVPQVTIDLTVGIVPWYDDSTVRARLGEPYPAILLKASEVLYVATSNASPFDVTAWGGDF